jgi:hypothetical protein
MPTGKYEDSDCIRRRRSPWTTPYPTSLDVLDNADSLVLRHLGAALKHPVSIIVAEGKAILLQQECELIGLVVPSS